MSPSEDNGTLKCAAVFDILLCRTDELRSSNIQEKIVVSLLVCC